MSIRMMTEPNTPGAVKDNYWSKEGRDIYTVESHKGLVLGLREMNGRDDSNFYATVWNDEKGAPEEVLYASTRGWTYPNGAAIDATDDVKFKYAVYREKRMAAARASEATRKAAEPTPGKRAKTVRAVKGKNAIEAGVTGTVFWLGADKFAPRAYYGAAPKMRVGFEADDGRKVFLPASAVEVIAA